MKRIRTAYRTRDCGGGFYIETERTGAATWYIAMQLDAPGGRIVNKRRETFSYARDAMAQIEAWRNA